MFIFEEYGEQYGYDQSVGREYHPAGMPSRHDLMPRGGLRQIVHEMVDDGLGLIAGFFKREQFGASAQRVPESVELRGEAETAPNLLGSHIARGDEAVHLKFRGIRIRSRRKGFVFVAEKSVFGERVRSKLCALACLILPSFNIQRIYI